MLVWAKYVIPSFYLFQTAETENGSELGRICSVEKAHVKWPTNAYGKRFLRSGGAPRKAMVQASCEHILSIPIWLHSIKLHFFVYFLPQYHRLRKPYIYKDSSPSSIKLHLFVWMQIYGPRGDSQSKIEFFPGIADAIYRRTEDEGRQATIQHEIWRVARAIQRAATALRGEFTWDSTRHWSRRNIYHMYIKLKSNVTIHFHVIQVCLVLRGF